jgi:ABC-2 type transport system permease protein
MSKISLIIKREYITRVKKKSFIIMTLLAPILMASFIVVPILITTMADKGFRKIAVIDNSNQFKETLKNKGTTTFEFIEGKTVNDIKDNFKKSGYYALLVIPDSLKNGNITMYSEKQPTIDVKMLISGALEKEIERRNLRARGIDEEILKKVKAKVDIETIRWKEGGKEEKSSTEMVMAVSFIAAFLIYMFVFIYGAQVMRGVMEEKSSRVVEIILSSVRPFQLMMGKIIGIALVAMTQFMLWVILTLGIITVVQTVIMPKELLKNSQSTQNVSMLKNGNPIDINTIDDNKEIKEIFGMVKNMPWLLIFSAFIFYFVGGYLLYASLFAAIGSAVDNETDTQQFMLPITIPIILAFVMAQAIIQNPDGQVAFWFSMIPLTSPIIMLVRIPFDVPVWQLLLSMFILVISFIGSTWMAAKIYRTGILLYGKKVTYKELWKWIKYSN